MSDDNTEWTPEQIRDINYEMATGIVQEIGDLLNKVPCHHGQGGHGTGSNTPPMFYPEAVMCAISYARSLPPPKKARPPKRKPRKKARK